MFKYYLKKQLNDKSFVFWTILFPICLMFCFKMAFSDLYASDNTFDPVKAVYVNESSYDISTLATELLTELGLEGMVERFSLDMVFANLQDGNYLALKDFSIDEDEFEAYLNEINWEDDIRISDEMIDTLKVASYSITYEMALRIMGTDGDNKCLDIIKADNMEEAQSLLESGEKHVLFVITDEGTRVELSKEYSNVDLIIVNSIMMSFDAQYEMIMESMDYYSENGFSEDEEEMLSFQNGFDESFASSAYIQAKADVFGEEPNPYNWYYYSTFVMAIMLNIITGIGIVADVQANITKSAMRVSVSPARKFKLLGQAFMARLVLIMGCEAFHLVIMKNVFDIPIGKRLPQLLLFVFIADLFVLSLGQLLGLVIKGNLNTKENIANAFLMLSVFISGEMVCALPGVIEKFCPIVNEINPATVMNFAFYRLVFFENLQGFYINLAKLMGAAIIFMTISVINLRRQRYASL